MKDDKILKDSANHADSTPRDSAKNAKNADFAPKDSAKAESKTFWPYGIAIFLCLMVCMIILTVVLALRASPENDNAYFSTRQDIDARINEILIDQKALDEAYEFYLIADGAKIPLKHKIFRKSARALELPSDRFSLAFSVVRRGGENAAVDSAKALLTRFATSKFDKDLGTLRDKDGIFTSDEIVLENGEWKLMLECKIDGKSAFFEHLIIVK